jgi:hypothetical protein
MYGPVYFYFTDDVPLTILKISVVDPDQGSGAFLTPGSRIRNGFFSGFLIPDPNPIFLRAY